MLSDNKNLNYDFAKHNCIMNCVMLAQCLNLSISQHKKFTHTEIKRTRKRSHKVNSKWFQIHYVQEYKLIYVQLYSIFSSLHHFLRQVTDEQPTHKLMVKMASITFCTNMD